MKEKTENIISLLNAKFGDSNPKLSKPDPLNVLIATMLSQNTTDKTSYRAFRNLKNDFKDWYDVMNSSEAKIRKAVKVCGLAGQKSHAIKELLKKLNKSKGSLSLSYIKKMSDEEIYEDLIQYNGVGIKTISCVLAFGLGRDVFPVDTHVHRLCNRLGLAKANTPDKTFSRMQSRIPEGKKFLLHTLLIRFGRNICKSKNPLCSKCILYDLCEFQDKEIYANIDIKNKKPVDNNFIIMEHI